MIWEDHFLNNVKQRILFMIWSFSKPLSGDEQSMTIIKIDTVVKLLNYC